MISFLHSFICSSCRKKKNKLLFCSIFISLSFFLLAWNKGENEHQKTKKNKLMCLRVYLRLFKKIRKSLFRKKRKTIKLSEWMRWRKLTGIFCCFKCYKLNGGDCLRRKKKKICQRAKNIVHDIWVIRDWNCSSLLNLSDENKKKALKCCLNFCYCVSVCYLLHFIVIPLYFFFFALKKWIPFSIFHFYTQYIFCAVHGCNFHFEDDVCFQKQEKVENEIV